MVAPAEDPIPEPIVDEAARWLAASEGDALSDDEKRNFAHWLAADTRHARAYAQMEEIWALMGKVPATALARTNVGLPQLRRLRWRGIRTLRRPRRAWVGPAIAASLALVFIGLAQDWPMALRADAMTTTGERRTVTLSDGSTVILDTNSAIAVRIGDRRRSISLLRGEAAFVVTPDRSRPFTVEANGGSATARGTRFLVRKDDAQAQVLVTEHSVRVTYPFPEGRSRVVGEGQSIAYDADGLGRVLPADTSDAMAWTQGVLVFKDKPLGEVVAEIGRYHRGYVRVLGDAQHLQVSGVFRIDDAVAAIDQLQRSLGLRSTRLTDRLIFLSS